MKSTPGPAAPEPDGPPSTEAQDLREYRAQVRQVPDDVAAHDFRVARYGRVWLENLKLDDESGPVMRDERGAIVGRGQRWGGNRQDPEAAIRHIRLDERPAYQLHFRGGRIVQRGPDGERPYDTRAMRSICGAGFGRAIFSMTRDGKVFAADQVGEYQHGDRATPRFIFHHSSFVAGGPVAAAGEIEVHDGRLAGVSNASGHYHATASMTRQLLLRLRDARVPLDGAYLLLARSRPGSSPDRARSVVCPAQLFMAHTTGVMRSARMLVTVRALIRSDAAAAWACARGARAAGSLIRAADCLAHAHRLVAAGARAPEGADVAATLVALHRDALRIGDARLREVDVERRRQPRDQLLVDTLCLSAHQAYRAAIAIDAVEGIEPLGRGYAADRMAARDLARYDRMAKNRLVF